MRVVPRARRRRAPLLVALWVLLGVEAAGGLVILTARLVTGARPGETVHVAAGLAFTVVWAIDQWRHGQRVAPFRAGLDHLMGLAATVTLGAANATGLWLGALWWRALPLHAAARYPVALSVAHLVGTMLALSFAGAHLGAVLLREPSLREVRR
jgi:hypothetical protein